MLYLLLGYVFWLVLLYFWQDKVIFPSDLTPPGSPPPAGAELLTLRTDGGTVEAWFFPCDEALQGKARPLVVYCHGNGELVSEQDWIVEGYRSFGVSVLLPEYRGYGNSEGRPSQQGIVADATVFLDMASGRAEVDKERIIIHGRSLGGAVAAQLALRRPPAALIIESTFTNVPGMALKYGLPPFLVRHPFRTDRAVRDINAPMLLLHGSQDMIVPIRHGRRLAAIAGERAQFVEYECGHNDFPGIGNRSTYWEEIRRFLERAGVPRPDG
jgi:hypothetical protein